MCIFPPSPKMNSLCLLVWVASTREVSFAICVQYEDVLDEEPQYQACKQTQQADEKHVLLSRFILWACTTATIKSPCVRNGVEVLLKTLLNDSHETAEREDMPFTQTALPHDSITPTMPIITLVLFPTLISTMCFMLLCWKAFGGKPHVRSRTHHKQLCSNTGISFLSLLSSFPHLMNGVWRFAHLPQTHL